MSGVAIEDLLELWSAELRKAKAKLGFWAQTIEISGTY